MPVRVGLSSSAGQSFVPLFCVALADAPPVVAVGTGPADPVTAEGSTAEGVRTAVGSGLGGAELGIAYPAIEGDGFA